MELVVLALAAVVAAWVLLAGKQGTRRPRAQRAPHTEAIDVAVRRLWWRPVEEPVPRGRRSRTYSLP